MKNKLLIFFMLMFATAPMIFAQTVISGKLLGYNGKPMQKANVTVTRLLATSPLETIKPNKNGSYKLKIKKNGYYFIEFFGVNHKAEAVPVLLEKSSKIKIDVRLQHNQYVDKISDLKIIGDFNDFDMRNAKKMKKNSNGTYTAEFKTDKEEFAYQVIGVEKNGIPTVGTGKANYTFNNNGTYSSVIKPKNGKVKISFNPKELVKSKADSKITFGKKNNFTAQAYKIFKGMDNRQENFMQQVQNNGGKIPKNIDWTKESKQLEAELQKQKNPELKKVLMLGYMQLALFGAKNLDTKIVKEAFAKIKPSSMLWEIDPRILGMTFGYSNYKGDSNYLDKVIEQNKVRNVVAFVLYMKVSQAKYAGDNEAAKKYYSKLVSQYSDTRFGQMAKRIPMGGDKVAVGKPVPDFSVVSYDDSSKVFSKKSMLGHVYLIDFWASWCGPCRQEMPNLQAAYEKYKDKGFEILSLSFDPKPSDVKKFRNGQWKMPWHHSFVTNGFRSALAQKFGVQGIPKPILVNSKGIVIAMQSQLRGPNLMMTLSKIYDIKK